MPDIQPIAASLTPIKESFVDVLIIGAGPAGVVFANALVHAGVNVRIVDKRAAGIEAGQADGCQPRTLEIMQSYGLADKLMRRGEHIWKSAFYNPNENGGIERTAYSSIVNTPKARYRFGVAYYQGGVESIFTESMRDKGLEVERATIPTLLEVSQDERALEDPNAYVNKVVLEHLDRIENNTEIVHAKFVLGSDGAHSWVRNTLGIEMEGDSTDSIWGVVDLRPDTDFPDIRCLSYVHARDGTLFVIPREDDLVRLYIQQDSGAAATSALRDPVTGRVDKDRTSAETLLAQGRKLLAPYRMDAADGKVAWWTVYVVGQRVATRYGVRGRALIAGDACHTHSPKAGQGMNAGMGDTHNLAWKIAYVLRGWASMDLLRTYESERRKYAQDLIEFDKKWSKLFTGKPRTAESDDGVTHEQFIGAFRKFGGFTSGVGIRYAPSLIVHPAHQPVARNITVGERMPPHIFVRAADSRPFEIQDLLPADTRFKVLVFAGDVAAAEDRAQLQQLADSLARPDSFLQRFGRGKAGEWSVFDMLCVSSAKQAQVVYLDFPAWFRSHWSKVLLDDLDIQKSSGGDGYEAYGIDEHAGAIVIVRPDGYVGMVAPLGGVEDVNEYFSAFLI